MARQVVATDDFTGANGTMDAGWSLWRNSALVRDGNGNAHITVTASTCGSFRNTGTYANNQYSEITCTNGSDSVQNVDVGVRGQSEGNGYLAIISTTNVAVHKVVASAFTLIGNVAGGQTWIAGDRFSIEVEDNGSNQPVFRVYKNGVQLGSDLVDTAASPYTGGRPIVCLRQDSSPEILITAWEGGDVVANVFSITGSVTTTITPAAGMVFVPPVQKTVTTPILVNRQGLALTNLTGINWRWRDTWSGAILHDAGGESTDGTGVLQISIPNSTLTNGQRGYLEIEIPDAGPINDWLRRLYNLPITVT